MPKSSSRAGASSASRSTRSKTNRSRTSPAKKSGASRSPHSKPGSRQPGFSFGSLSLDRKLDILGIIFVLSGFLILLSLLSSERGFLFNIIIQGLSTLAGWGAFVLPVALVVLGLWLVFRKIEALPQISFERIFGAGLLYVNILAWLHFFLQGGWEEAKAGLGGGYLGAFFLNILISTLGTAGGVIVLVAWLVIALVFTLDISLPDLYRRMQAAPNQDKLPPASTPLHLNRSLDSKKTSSNMIPADMPGDFHPLPDKTSAPARRGRQTRESAASQTGADKASAAHTQASTQPAGIGNPQLDSAVQPTSTPTPTVPWKLPAVDQILDPVTPFAQQTNLDHERGALIEETLASFGAPAHVVDISRGPTVTRFGVEPDFVESRSGKMRVRVSKITSLADDLALALAAPRIRIQAPVPGRSYVGIEVPNIEISRVAMREVLESDSFRKIRSQLRFTLGKDVAGKPVAGDLAAMPHLLIAGTTGSGKSVCVNSILTSLLLNNTPADLRMILVDPKRVELTGYNGIPHLLSPVVVDTERVLGALQWLQREMDARYHRFSQTGARNIEDYNAHHGDRLPYYVAVIDELADLMMVSPDETERSITRLAQLARATGIHLILATQRPSVDVVTGLIKANFPARIAFAVASGVDSRVILDQPGAERLLGRGDMLFQAPDSPAPVRLQGVYVSDIEIQRLVQFWHDQASELKNHSPNAVVSNIPAAELLPSGIPLIQGEFWEGEKDGDALLSEAIDLVRREGRASITMLQRRLRIGYTRAARIVDAMEEKGIISPALPNSQVREILDYGQAAPPEDSGY